MRAGRPSTARNGWSSTRSLILQGRGSACRRRYAGPDIRELLGGPVLGVLTGTDYIEETFTLEKGTALVMVTDDVVEGPGLTLEAGLKQAGTLAGQALHDGLNAEAIADRILDAAVAVDHLDDVAVLVIRRT
ncbi:SpoIIE family protein phosphatase [Streptomyces sp. NBC_00154]|uniref:SpoIIE family protein phosphatase n=1 Tax=Streptomyces sp. NBC_00154 TaxID=2975670 RepID=UPI002B1D7F72|nr:SpoIIE family protein phosphatase [Streptomyces sp. NBC_00154]